MAVTEKVSVDILFPVESVSNQTISSAAGKEITAVKQENVQEVSTNFALAIATTPPVAREEIVFIAAKPGTISRVIATLDNTGTSGVAITFDLEKNGTTVLSAPISFTHADSDGSVKTGTISSASFVAGDRFSMVLAGTMGTGAAGPIMRADFVEVRN